MLAHQESKKVPAFARPQEKALSDTTQQANSETKEGFTPDMTIRQAMDLHPEAGLVLASYHLGGCSHCGVNQIETLGQVCSAYGIPVDALISSLNDLLQD